MTTDYLKKLISAQVILFPDDRTSEKDALECEKYFSEAGFELGQRFAGSFAISASADIFEQVFDCNIVSDEHGTHCNTDTGSIDYAVPLDKLHNYLRSSIRAVTFTAPPDFGPGNFQGVLD